VASALREPPSAIRAEPSADVGDGMVASAFGGTESANIVSLNWFAAQLSGMPASRNPLGAAAYAGRAGLPQLPSASGGGIRSPAPIKLVRPADTRPHSVAGRWAGT
jgi:hypothetical protein